MTEPYNDSLETYEDQEQKIQDLLSFVRAVTARIDGEWDNPHLMQWGALHINEEWDIKHVAREVLDKYDND